MNEQLSSVLFCTLLSCGYVVPFYLWRSEYPRNHPKTIWRRTVSTTISCLGAFGLTCIYLKDASRMLDLLGFNSSAVCVGWIRPLLAIILLFFGPIVAWVVDPDDHGPFVRYKWPFWTGATAWRDLFIAPVFEEFLFRGLICAVLIQTGFSKSSTILLAPLFFGAAHLHHLHELVHHQSLTWTHAATMVTMQFAYTTVFGWIAAVFLVHEHSLVAAILPHAFCNLMGFPNFARIKELPNCKLVYLCYVVGAVGFVFALTSFISSGPL